jgi:hypothetical protein
MKVFLAAPTDTAKNLKTFQEVKFTHMFNTWFNPQKDTITMSNITDWVEKIRYVQLFRFGCMYIVGI